MWNDVKYEPGELKVVAYGADGNKVGETSIHTAGKAAAVALKADKNVLAADGEDLAYVTVSLVDKDGNELPTASDNISVEVSGAASFRGICNGDATSLEVFTQPRMKLFGGKLVVTLQAANAPGVATLKVVDKSNKNVKPASVEIQVK